MLCSNLCLHIEASRQSFDPLPNSSLTVYRPEIFDEYTRRQYVAKAPNRNPFGVEEEPARFEDFNVFTKVQPPTVLSVEYPSHNSYSRFESYNSLPSGQWETQTASANEWKNKRTRIKLFGYGYLQYVEMD